MKILSSFLANISNVNKLNKTSEAKMEENKDVNTSSVKKDEVILSKEAENIKSQNKEEVEYYKARLFSMNESENEKIESIKQKYANGTYNADLSEVADSFLDSNPGLIDLLK